VPPPLLVVPLLLLVPLLVPLLVAVLPLLVAVPLLLVAVAPLLVVPPLLVAVVPLLLVVPPLLVAALLLPVPPLLLVPFEPDAVPASCSLPLVPLWDEPQAADIIAKLATETANTPPRRRDRIVRVFIGAKKLQATAVPCGQRQFHTRIRPLSDRIERTMPR
jgi:hypothetical protein